jgi:glycine/D-amino acid oxidase-like deaminating enzyme
MSPTHTFDAVVIGGGILGGATMFELADSTLNIGWIEPQHKRNEMATAAAGAMLGAYGEIGAAKGNPREEVEFEFRLQSQAMFPEWLSRLEEASGVKVFQTNGTFVVGNAAGPEDRATLRNIIAYSEKFSGDAEWVEATDVPGLRPASRYEPVGCVHLPTEGAVSTEDILRSFHAVASRNKRVRAIDDEVLAIERSGDGWLVSCRQGAYQAPIVVICAGSRSASFLPAELFGEAAFPELYFGKGVSSLVEAERPFSHTIRTPNRAFACGVHVVPRPGSTVYVGATNFFGAVHEEEAGVEVGELHILFDQAIHQIDTSLRRATVHSTRFGYRPITTQRTPLVGESKADGIYIATGTYRNGVVMAPLIAKTVANEVLGLEPQYQNPYHPREVIDQSAASSLGEVIESGIEDIVAILHEPNGVLPYDRSRELSQFLGALFKLAMSEDDESGLRRKIHTRLTDIPLNETMNRVFYDVMTHQRMQTSSAPGELK